ncbi:MAG: hypothetical protein RSF92_11215 [Niameybacter sp.]|uniref:hypothetical protein n=1 Tax=Niameybacter sp. TaxID=2033640 RepID=UPI002FCA6283
MNNVGDIGLGLQLDGKGYKKQIKQFGDYGSNQLQSSFSSTFKSIGKLAVAAFSIKAITDFSASCLKLGSDLTEVQNVVDVAFPAMNSQVNDFAKNAITQFGLSETIAKRYAGTFGAMSKAFGFTEQASADMAMELTGLAGDVASFYNLSPDEAYTKLKSVFTGETESLKDLGVVMTQSALDQYALAKGYAKTTAQMSEQEKVELRMGFVTKQLSTASGDFMRTQDSWANQTRVLTLQWESFKASIGKGLIALFAPIVKGVNWVLSNLQPLADSFASLMEMLTGTKSSSGGALATTAGEITSATEGTDTLSEGLTGAGKSGEKAAKKINKAFAKVDTINKLSFDTGDSDPVESGTGGISNGSVASAVNFPEAGKQGTAFQGVLDGLISEFKRLSDIFKFGFEIGFGESAQGIERIKIGLSSIGTSIVSIFTDPKVMGAALSWIEYTTFALGSFVGSVASIGVSIGELFVGSIAKYLETNTKFIKDRLISIFDISKDSNIILGAFYAVIADIAGIFTSPQAINTGSDFIRIIYNSMMLQVDGFLRVPIQ